MQKAIRAIRKYKYIYGMMLPGLLVLLLFNYLPILGNIMAFQNFEPFGRGVLGGIIHGEWVGLAHFKNFFNSPYFSRLLWNTLSINLYKLIFSFPFPIVFAILLNELRRNSARRVIQTVASFPHFISWVIVTGLIVTLFTAYGPLVNDVLPKIGIDASKWLTSSNTIVPMLVISTMWKSFGWGAIVYLAAITGIDTELFEAARIDGANRFKQIWHIMLPGMAPAIIIMLLTNIGNIINADIAQFMTLVGNKAFLYEKADVIATYVYRTSMLGMKYSFAAAVDLFRAVVALVMVVGADRVAKLLGQDGIW